MAQRILEPSESFPKALREKSGRPRSECGKRPLDRMTVSYGFLHEHFHVRAQRTRFGQEPLGVEEEHAPWVGGSA